MSIVTIQNLIYTHLKKDSKQRPEMNRDNSTEWKTWQVYSFGKRNVLRFDFWVQRGFLWERKGKVISMQLDLRQRRCRNQQWRVLYKESEAESIRSRAKSIRGCVKLKTVNEKRQNSACDTFIGWFSKAGLHEWMPFVIFDTRSHKKLQLLLLGRFLSGVGSHWV